VLDVLIEHFYLTREHTACIFHLNYISSGRYLGPGDGGEKTLPSLFYITIIAYEIN
jgi:hypothetical protein